MVGEGECSFCIRSREIGCIGADSFKELGGKCEVLTEGCSPYQLGIDWIGFSVNLLYFRVHLIDLEFRLLFL